MLLNDNYCDYLSERTRFLPIGNDKIYHTGPIKQFNSNKQIPKLNNIYLIKKRNNNGKIILSKTNELISKVFDSNIHNNQQLTNQILKYSEKLTLVNKTTLKTLHSNFIKINSLFPNHKVTFLLSKHHGCINVKSGKCVNS